MLFNSFQFALLMTAVFFWYWRLDLPGQKRLLLAASVLFYAAWSVPLIALLALSAWVDYVAALQIARIPSRRGRRAWVAFAVVCNLGVLGYFKYAEFFLHSLDSLLGALGVSVSLPVLEVVLPLGISFYTFQAMAYTIDVYRGQLEPAASFWDVLLFIMFFPQLVAGPILRGSELLPQLARAKRLEERDVTDGLFRIASGVVKKVVIADHLAKSVTPIFLLPAQQTPLELLLGVYGFAVQIYCDFSGYTDIAIGCGRLLGFQLRENFDRPYLSASLSEFWRRWHMSLSTWFRDYLYIPLGGSRRGPRRALINLMLTMLIGGLWHGAAWTFVIWGGYHGVLLALERFWRARVGDRVWVPIAVGRLLTFHLVCLGWILFRSPDLATAWAIVRGIASFQLPGSLSLSVVMLVGLLATYLGARWVAPAVRTRLRLNAPGAVAYAALIVGVLLVGGRQVDFIYFQF